MKLELRAEFLGGRRFAFKRRDGTFIARELILEKDGTIAGHNHPNEVLWNVEDGSLIFRDRERKPTTVFDYAKLGHGLIVHGRYVLGPDPCDHWHQLEDKSGINPVLPVSVAKIDTAVNPLKNKVAVLVRSFLLDEKYDALVAQLERGRRHFDLYSIVDDTRGRRRTPPGEVIWHSVESCQNLGLAHTHQILLIVCGDFPFYVALREIPQYEYYLMIEDDVDLLRNDGSFVDSICARLSAGDLRDVDLIILKLGKMQAGIPRHLAARRHFPDAYCFGAYFPFVVLSKAATAFLLSQRQLEGVKRPAPDDVLHCEAFVPSCLMSGGFRCIDLNDAAPGSYAMETMGMQIGGLGKPMGYRLQTAPEIEMVHPIYSPREYLERAYRTFGLVQGDWGRLLSLLQSEETAGLPEDLKEAIRLRAIDHINSDPNARYRSEGTAL